MAYQNGEEEEQKLLARISSADTNLGTALESLQVLVTIGSQTYIDICEEMREYVQEISIDLERLVALAREVLES